VRLGIEALFGSRVGAGEGSNRVGGVHDAMNQQAQALLATRTVAVRSPNGETEYWLTDQVFAEGDTLTRNGHVLTVAEVVQPSRSGSHLTVRLTYADG
jgi:hypothetical protein